MVKTNPRNVTKEDLKKCQGCILNNMFVEEHLDYLSKVKKANCILIQNIENTTVIKEKTNNSGIYVPRGTKCPTLSPSKILTLVSNRYDYNKNNPPVPFKQKNSNKKSPNRFLIKNIIIEQNYREKLLYISTQLQDHPNIEFYTDGSLSNLKTPNCKMEIG